MKGPKRSLSLTTNYHTEDAMFNTAKNTIKKAAKDQVEFFLVLLTGLFVGSIFTLAYIKYWDTSKVTFADIGGMLAGVGTIGLLLVAFNARKEWQKQLLAQQTSKAIDNYFLAHIGLMNAFEKISRVQSQRDYESQYGDGDKIIKSPAFRDSQIHRKKFDNAHFHLKQYYKKDIKHAQATEELEKSLNSIHFKSFAKEKIKLKELEEELITELHHRQFYRF
jgi:type II secretory pathway pseudopilin PulG